MITEVTSITGEKVWEDDTVVSRAENAVDGSIDFGSIRYTAPGTYNYIIREVQGDDDKVTYDTTEYQVTVEVTESEGRLVATITYHTEDGEVPVFVNKVDAVDPEQPTTPTNLGKPTSPGESGNSELPASGEESYIWIGVIVMLSGLGLVISERFLSGKRN